MNEVTWKLLQLNKLKGIGPAALRKLISLPGFSAASIGELGKLNNALGKALAHPNAWDNALREADQDLSAAVTLNARIICELDDEYSPLLKATQDRPFFLYIRGNWAPDVSRSVAIIGTRQPTQHGTAIAERITEYFVSAGWSVVSGLAIGCDAIAHRTAMTHGGHTVAVLAHGLQTVAPKQHQQLAEQILDKGGALVTEYGFGVEPTPHQFAKRDRIQAGLAAGVVMIQSDTTGGSLHASRASIDYERILAVPCATDRDVINCEVKIEANKILCRGSQKEKIELLKCNEKELSLLISIDKKEDYPQVEQRLISVVSRIDRNIFVSTHSDTNEVNDKNYSEQITFTW